jgi:hypothetical protein
MNKLLILLLVASLIVNLLGLYCFWEYRKMKGQIFRLDYGLDNARRSVGVLTDALDRLHQHRMVFFHHSVGKGLLYQGGLSDSLSQLGILVKGATYGDQVGQQTDMADWAPKFQNDMSRILTFKGHPDIYYKNDTTNDIVMFKSCFPNSYVESDGSAPGNPTSRERTLANYKAVFESLGKEMRKYPNKLFVYLTYPPLVPPATTPEIAARARQFNRWLIGEYLPAYQKETKLENFVIFDLFDVLADSSNVLKAEYRIADPSDSHLNDVANKEAAKRFMDFFRPLWGQWLERHPASQAGAGR